MKALSAGCGVGGEGGGVAGWGGGINNSLKMYQRIHVAILLCIFDKFCNFHI